MSTKMVTLTRIENKSEKKGLVKDPPPAAMVIRFRASYNEYMDLYLSGNWL